MDKRRLEHYRIYMKIYGAMIVELADHDEEIAKIIDGDDLGGLLTAPRERIENSPSF